MTVLTMKSGPGDHPAATTAPGRATGPESDGAIRRLRSGAWPRQVKVEITRIEHRLQIALVKKKTARAQAVAEAIRAHLREAQDVIRPRKESGGRFSPIDWYRGTSIEQAYRSLHAARVFLLELVTDEDIDALVPGVLARVQSCLPATDPQRIELEKLPRADKNTKRAKLIRALERGYAASDEAHAQVRRFRNVLLCTAALIALFTLLLVCAVTLFPKAVPLCFQPDITTAKAAARGLPPTASSRLRNGRFTTRVWTPSRLRMTASHARATPATTPVIGGETCSDRGP